MKRILLISMLLIIAASMMFGQIAYRQGDQVISLQLGLGTSLYESGATGTVPPLTAAFDYGYNEHISLGGLLSYTGSKYDVSDAYGTISNKFSYIIVAVRGAYHYDLLHNDKIDTYGGLMLGYDIASTSHTVTGLYTSYSYLIPTYSVGGFSFGAFIGGRYFFSPQLAAQVELGYGIAYFNIGLAYKL